MGKVYIDRLAIAFWKPDIILAHKSGGRIQVAKKVAGAGIP
ncbi:hypothetical protein CAter282_3163 [Collimonas arenae]|uniref:Uncharacterized protein n=1 Tax=Collimonas arenae TaxID=279058 RepID=A0A127QLD4_9BURK|nr:hypothetical protein CAter10_3472 [Collimonas arenae]AMP10870.1 hypothetical protein CAter282_3163 [Collimonas arenae]